MDLRSAIADAVYENPGAEDIIDAVMEVMEARVRELEAHNELLQRQLDTAHGKRPGIWGTWAEHAARKQTTPPAKPRLSLAEARRHAAEHVRALKGKQ